jgi:hypothetical protein
MIQKNFQENFKSFISDPLFFVLNKKISNILIYKRNLLERIELILILLVI